MNFKTDRHRMDLATGLLFLVAAIIAFFAHVTDGGTALVWLALGALFLAFAAGPRHHKSNTNTAVPLPR